MIERATIYALASGRPPAAIAIIRISGPVAHEVAASLIGDLPEPRAAALRDVRNPGSGDLLDQALVLRFDAPASATGEDVVELHCHGGRAVVDAIHAALAGVGGLREAQPGEFTRRAFENGRIDLTEAEGLADLLAAETEAQRRAALTLAGGGLRAQIAKWQEQVLTLSARAERAIDYAEEDEDGSDPSINRDCAALATELRAWVARPRIEPLKDGIKVVVAGPPNAGKSSLINAIAGEERAIVTPVPGTTRDSIEVPLALEGLPILLTDTAGLRETDDPVEALGVGRAQSLIKAADILLWMGVPAAVPNHPRTIVLRGKADLAPAVTPGEACLPVSALTGEGIAELLKRVCRLAQSLVPNEDAVALNRRQARHLREAAEQISAASMQLDPVLLAEHLRGARVAFDQLTGRAGMEDVLDQLFSRFCLGK